MTDEKDSSAGVLARVQVLEDREAILELLHRVCFTIDGAVAADWLDCFIQEGVFSWTRDPDVPPVLDLRGRDALAAWFAQHRDANAVGSQTHIFLHPVVTVRSDAADVASSYMTLRAVGGDVVVASAGRYADRVQRGHDGLWRLVERRSFGTMMRTSPATGT